MSRRGFISGITLACGALLIEGAGCRHAATSDTSAGLTAFHFVKPEAAPRSGRAGPSGEISASRDIVTDAQAIPPLAVPVYPPTARTAKVGVMTMGVRVSLDAEGRVTDISPTVTGLGIPAPLAREFRASIDAAIMQWKFQPAEVQHLEEAADGAGKTYLRMASREKIPAVFEVVFSFTETGEVRTGAGRR